MNKVTPRQAARMVKRFNAGMNDPMTEAMHAGEFVSQSFSDSAHRCGMSIESVHELAEEYVNRMYNKRTAYRDPARLRWKLASSERRCYEQPKPTSTESSNE